MKVRAAIAAGLVLVLLVLAWAGLRHLREAPGGVVLLLLPDAAAADHPVAQAWIDAAREEGLRVLAATDDEFIRSGDRQGRVAGVILPDTVHRHASALLIDSLRGYVRQGGRLMLAFDAGVLGQRDNAYAQPHSRLSDLAGVDYAMYERLRGAVVGAGTVHADAASALRLGIQPGKLDFARSAVPGLGELTTYGYPQLRYEYHRTAAEPRARVLMRSHTGDAVVAEHRFGRGTVLFANVALGYLKTRTDGYLLHLLLRHYLLAHLQLPYLTAVPEGVGGMVLNVHIDSNAAQAPLLALERRGWFDAGPFSFHATAGPDTYRHGDATGLDVGHNPAMQAFFRRMAAKGHEIGNHGGWLHNVFGENATEANQAEYEPYLDKNHAVMTQVLGRPIRSYSAPEGNQPLWSTRWLERNGFTAYYFTGDAGLGPTRSYQGGRRPAPLLWAFPVSHFGTIATLEELERPGAPGEQEMAAMLTALANYSADQRVARLFYFHPPASTKHDGVLDALWQQAERLRRQGRFRWYTMEGLAGFLSRREAAQWHLEKDDASGASTLVAASSAGLESLAWIVPGGMEDEGPPAVLEGSAAVRWDRGQWVVTAGACDRLRVRLR